MSKNWCTCGDHIEEHGGDPESPGSTACMVKDCDCKGFEPGEVPEGFEDE
jgi:hypothetical protein